MESLIDLRLKLKAAAGRSVIRSEEAMTNFTHCLHPFVKKTKNSWQIARRFQQRSSAKNHILRYEIFSSEAVVV